MLTSLHIENMAVIERLDVDFDAGLSAVTGETGAGKSVMIDCIAFLTGARPARELVRHGAESGAVSALFCDVSAECLEYLAENGFETDGEVLLQRTLTNTGKAVARINGRVASQAVLRGAARFLINIHGQNDNQLLLQRAAQARILDGTADLGKTLDAYHDVYVRHGKIVSTLDAWRSDTAEKERLRDILRFEIAEIDAAHLKKGEEDTLAAARAKLQNAEKIAKNAGFAYHVLYGSEKGAVNLLERAATAVSQLAGVIPEAEGVAKKLQEMRYETEDLAATVRDFAEGTDKDPTEALNRVEARLDLISKLCRKYGENVEKVLAFRAEAAEKLRALSHTDEESAKLSAEEKELRAEMERLSDALYAARTKAAHKLEKAVLNELRFLDMPNVRFEIAVRKTEEFYPLGRDEAEFMIAANAGEPPMPLSAVASGGELARIMLALRAVLNDRDGVGTAVFDEVDTGISGKTARKIGIKLAEIGRRTQVLCVTHSAQIASLAAAHYKIEKREADGRARSGVVKLDEAGRVAEVARILGGLSVTKSQEAAAVDMIEEGKAFR